jgi:8-oxo-dGTP pyrophosphatase MutT (NUDIX family)
MPRIDKVTAFITRDGRDLLLFQHPHAGVQIPAGTVEDGETPAQAVKREANEETGLTALSIRRYLGHTEEQLPEGHRIVAQPTRVYARPEVTSFDWAYLRKGIPVTVNRRSNGFAQVTYEELDRVPDPQYVTMCITGWVPQEVLADVKRRHFFHLEFHGQSKERWTVFTDNHHFALFWAPLAALPQIISPQDEWLTFLRQQFRLHTLE